MESVLFDYVVDGVVVESQIPYRTVLERTGLTDTVGFAELGYVEHFPVVEAPVIPKELVDAGIRNMRNQLLQQCDWTQLPDASLDAEAKALWTAYRQQLRDIPATYADATSVFDVEWPTAPDAPTTV